MEKVIAETKANGKNSIAGKEAFVLYDTYGFPLDLTELILKENSLTVNIAEFDAEMAKQKERARNAASIEASDWVVVNEGESEFVGYDETETETKVLKYRKVKQKNNEYYQIVLEKTPFYAEMGGQVGDTGILSFGSETIEITDTKRENNLAIHISKKMPSNPSETVFAKIDKEARLATSANHSATHLLHEALREVLGTHVEQKGSFVSPKLLRFDFSHFQKMTNEEIRKVERLANKKVRKAILLEEFRHTPIEEAKAMGAMALFGEKYGEDVRVIKYGSSIELCGGTHVKNTGNIGMIKILSESSIAAGIRRIEAITGETVENTLYEFQDTMTELSGILNSSNVIQAIKKTIAENGELKKEAENMLKERIKAVAAQVIDNRTEVNGINVYSLKGPRIAEAVKGIAFAIREESPEKSIFVGATLNGDKPMLTVLVTDDLAQNGFNASTIVREAAKLIKGGGGGQPQFAQAGGKNAEGLSAAYDKIMEIIASI